MADTRKDVFLLCEPQPGITHQQLVGNLAATFKKDRAVIEKMLGQRRFLIKKDVDAALAAKYELAITKAGGMCELHSRVAELPRATIEPERPPIAVELKSPKYGHAETNGKSKRMVKAVAIVLFLVLAGILAVIYFLLLRDNPRAPAAQSDSLPSAAEQSASIPTELPALNQRFFSADRRLSINVPDDWQERRNISEGASIGAGNSALEVYVIVMAESREDFSEDFTLSNYTDAVLSLTKNIMQTAQLSPALQSYKINGLPAQQAEIAGEVDGLNIRYLLTTVESDKGFFHLLSWTTAARYEANRSLMREVANSLVIRSFPAF